MRESKVFFHHCLDVARRNRMQIEDIRDLDLYRFRERVVVYMFCDRSSNRITGFYEINGKLARFKSYI